MNSKWPDAGGLTRRAFARLAGGSALAAIGGAAFASTEEDPLQDDFVPDSQDRLLRRISSLRMREWQDELGTDPELAAAYLAAHEAYLAERDAKDVLPTRMTAGGMPDRVKCLHALAGHALAVGPGVNPIGDRAVAEMGEWWAKGPCAQPEGTE